MKMSHNVYSERSVADRNILNHIINSTEQASQTNLVSNAPKSYTVSEIITYVFEFVLLLICFLLFCVFLAMAPAFDAQIIEWMGR